MSLPLVSRGPRVDDPNARSSIESLVESIQGSGMVRRQYGATLVDFPYSAEPFYENDVNTDTDTITSASYQTLTGITATVVPPAGIAYVVLVTAEVTFTHTATTEVWLTISNGTDQQGQRKSISANEECMVGTSFIERITTNTTYTLRAKNNAAGDTDCSAIIKHMAVHAWPVPERFGVASEPWEVPVHAEDGRREVVRRIRLIRGSPGIAANTLNHYRIKAGIRKGAHATWLGEYDGAERGIPEGGAYLMTGQGEVSDGLGRLPVGAILVCQVQRFGEPVRLAHTRVEFEVEMVGD